MTGVLNAMVGVSGGSRYTVTIGNSGNNYGFNDGTPIGSISSSSFRGATIRVVSDDNAGNTFTVTLSGSRVQSFFAGVEIQATNGSIAIFNTPAAIFNDLGTVTAWQWTTSNDIWTSTSPATRFVRLF